MDDHLNYLREFIKVFPILELAEGSEISTAYKKLLAEVTSSVQSFDQNASQQAQIVGRQSSGSSAICTILNGSELYAVGPASGRPTLPMPNSSITTAEQFSTQPVIAYRMEDGIAVLLPTNKRQCQDAPSLIARAAELGASYTGVFKYVLPDDVDFDPEIVRVNSLSTFTSQRRKNGAYHVNYHRQEQPMEVRRSQPDAVSARELAAALEQAISDPEKLCQMRYATDCPARTPEERQNLGIPVESPLSSLKGNQLDLTTYGIDGIHWPDAYLSNESGGLFVMHSEDGNLHSFNALHFGLRVVIVVAPRHAHLIERLFKEWSCAQRVRHSSDYIPTFLLDQLNVSYCILLQRPREVIGFMPFAYHQGGTLWASSAEAVNYAALGWSINGYSECRRGRNGCPGFPIPNAYLAFRAPGERQLEQESHLFDSVPDRQRKETTALSPGITSAQNKAGPSSEDTEMSRGVEDGAGGGRSRTLRGRTYQPGVSHPTTRPHEVREATILMTKKRPANTSAPRKPPKMVKAKPSELDQELIQTEAQIKRVDKRCNIPAYDKLNPPNPRILKLAAAICSRPVIEQFLTLVRSRRDSDFGREGSGPLSDIHQRIESCVRSIQRSERRSTFERFVTRLDQWRLAENLEIARQGRSRNDSLVIDALCKSLSWKRSALDYHRKMGQGWKRVCGPYDGLLGFVPFASNAFGISVESYLELQGPELEAFHGLLNHDYVKGLCIAGRAFQESLDRAAWDVEFRWESVDGPISHMSEEDMLSYLQPFPSGHDDLYDGLEHAWTRPVDWPKDWQWPIDPTTILEQNAAKCDHCCDTSCGCIRDHLADAHRPKPRIKSYGQKGRGLQAVAGRSGQVAYEQGETIGRLVGKIVPSDLYKDGWSMELMRSDLPEAEPVCHIHYRDYGNPFRLLNHSCKASAYFQVIKISGKYRILVKALRDIRDREEITVNYGKEYLATSGLKCLCEVCTPGKG